MFSNPNKGESSTGKPICRKREGTLYTAKVEDNLLLCHCIGYTHDMRMEQITERDRSSYEDDEGESGLQVKDPIHNIYLVVNDLRYRVRFKQSAIEPESILGWPLGIQIRNLKSMQYPFCMRV